MNITSLSCEVDMCGCIQGRRHIRLGRKGRKLETFVIVLHACFTTDLGKYLST